MSAAHEGFRLGLLATATGLGFRHGIDWDHIAAISDLSAAQNGPRRAMASASAYFLGHGLVIASLGAVAIVAGEHVPSAVDVVMEKVVGATLVLLGGYVLVSLVRHGRGFTMRSRWMLIFAGVRRAAAWQRRRRHPDPALAGPHAGHGSGHHHHPGAELSFWGPSSILTSMAVGALHGVGAETPTQVLLLAAAATAGGAVPGMLLLGAFLVGLFLSNSVVGLTVSLGFFRASRNFALYAGVSVLTGVGGMVVGALLLSGSGDLLPSILSG